MPDASASAADDTAAPTRAALYRHPSDVARLVFSSALLGLVLLAATLGDTQLSGFAVDIIALVDGLPRALANALVGLVQLFTVLVPAAVVTVLVRRRQWTLMGLLALAGAIAGVSMLLLSDLVEESIPFEELGYERIDSWFIGSQYPSSTYLAALTACLVTGSPWMRSTWRRTGWVFVAFVVLARGLSATEVPVRNLMLLVVGAAAGSLALVVFGAPRRRVDVASVETALRRAGVDATRLEPRRGEIAMPTFTAESPEGDGLLVKVVGRDQRDSNLLLRTWRWLTLKDIGRTAPSSPRRAVEHEALALGIFGVGARTPQPLAVLQTDDEAAVLVTSRIDGSRLSELDTIDDGLLAAAWTHVAELQHRRLAHGDLNLENLVATESGDVVLVDLSEASLDAGDNALGIDVAELLASSAATVGADRAVAAAASSLPSDVLERAVPLLQPAVLSRTTRAQFKERSVELDQLRDAAAHAAGVEQVETAEIRRLTVGGVVSLIGSIVLVAYVLNLAANWEDTWDAFTSADLWYVIPIVLMMISTYFSGAMSLIGSVTVDLVYMRTVAVMFGQSYLNRFTPANAGGMAMRVRYLQLNGVDTPVAASAIALTSAASGVAQVVTIIVFLVWGGSSDRLSDFEMPDIGAVVIIILAIGLVAGAVLYSTWGRKVVLPWLKTAMSKVKESIGDLLQRPSKLAQLFGGALLGKLANIISFWASMAAFGVDISFPKAGAIYIIATTIGSAVPTPGGVGGVEAALTAALMAYGVDNATAAAIVLFFRTLTFWLPTLPGYGFFRYTQAKGIV